MSSTMSSGPVLATIREAHTDTLDEIEDWISGCIDRGAMSLDLSAELRQAVAARRDELAAGTPNGPIHLEHLTRLELNPGDTLVATASNDTQLHRMNDMQLHHMYASLKAWMQEHHPGVHVLVLPPGTELAVLGRDIEPLLGRQAVAEEEIRRGIVDEPTARRRAEETVRESRW